MKREYEVYMYRIFSFRVKNMSIKMRRWDNILMRAFFKTQIGSVGEN